MFYQKGCSYVEKLFTCSDALLYFSSNINCMKRKECASTKSPPAKKQKKQEPKSKQILEKQSDEELYSSGIYYYSKLHEYEEALRYFEASALKNNPKARFFLALMYYKGLGCKKNLSLALKHCNIAKKRGITNASQLLSDILVMSVREILDTKKEPINFILKPEGREESIEEDSPPPFHMYT
jgi:TPR repeat protein